MAIDHLLFAAEGISSHDMEKGLSLAGRVHPKYQPVFEKLEQTDRAAVALYFLAPWFKEGCA